MDKKVNQLRLNWRIAKAAYCIGKGIVYKLGKGGFFPSSALPCNRKKQLDCSGFIAWVIGISRLPKLSRPWWIESTNICRDALGAQTVFVEIEKPVPGCIAVRPDTAGREGHVALVSKVQGFHVTLIDCTGAGVTERVKGRKESYTYCLLKEDFVD